MAIGVIIGIGITLMVMAYFFFSLNKGTSDGTEGGNNHFLLQLLVLFFIMGGVLLMGNAVKEESRHCDWLVSNTTTNTTFTDYQSFYACNESSGTGETFFKTTLWFTRLLALYIFVFFVYRILVFAGAVVPK